MYLPLVAGVDGSEPSLRAVDWAADEAALHGVSLLVLYGALWERYEGSALARELGKPFARVEAEDILRAAAERARRRRPDLLVTTETVPDEAEHGLVCAGRNASMIVVGNRGRSGVADRLLGSVSRTVAAASDCPVVVLRGNHDDRAVAGRHGRIIVGLGDAPTSVLQFAFTEARLRRVPLTVVRAWRCPAHETVDHPLLTGEPARLYEERAAKELEAALEYAPSDIAVRRRTTEGPARSVLPAASSEADLMVIGRRAHGRLGRVAHSVLHRSACPVVVVPEQR
ncbi:universal stress protein [Streptomyces rochei]|uniref:Universal stress protein n=2 Tax=Streptomyces rochei group TaxID=2867164 RepID=A0ABW7E2L9_STRRO|nr:MULTISPECIES: universal stress protein [Streptomyces]NEC70338.1 universal stress protein [Streptomyces rochei]NUV97794.1 universal stress protein [Streptomyces sp. KAI 90]RSS62978.1 universal stress protein [Streptomyces sp. WAC06273]GGZ86770.1 universal stress protein [Streptomyces plicatus]